MVMTEDGRLQTLYRELEQVKAAIAAIQSGAQEYRIGSRSLRKPDLGLLYQERDRLEREINYFEQGGTIFRYAYFEGR